MLSSNANSPVIGGVGGGGSEATASIRQMFFPSCTSGGGGEGVAVKDKVKPVILVNASSEEKNCVVAGVVGVEADA